MVKKLPSTSQNRLPRHYYDALVASGLVDDIEDVGALDPRPIRLLERDHVCRRGEPAHCLWVIVDGAVAVRDSGQTLFLRQRHDVVGEQNLLGNGCLRWYDLVVSHSQAELLVIEKSMIEAHPQRDVLWRNISKIISLKLREATRQNLELQRQVNDDTRILHAHMNEYALSRRLQKGGARSIDYGVERAVVWFSDVVNFSRYILDLAPARTADVVQRFFNAQTQPIQEMGGHIDKFVGDGLMAFWVPPGDSSVATCCEAALRAAEQAVEAVRGISIGPNALDLRVGLHTGLVLSGDFGSATRHQFTLIGPEVNKAARLEQVHEADVRSGEPHLGPIRMSAEFRAELSDLTRRRYGRQSVAEAKNIGEITFYH
ncbi:MAG TPA: adenylate/guanylate cyclase domain-containing protein [Thermohalobaculum sp.]|nr:adenylate/guanylate cyclase domain-containing protein [Thermohalobaculum sp.]